MPLFIMKKVIKLSQAKNSNAYFAPNSCLHLGYIYEKQQNIQKAISYFEKAITYENHEYKGSIDNKAKAKLNQLK